MGIKTLFFAYLIYFIFVWFGNLLVGRGRTSVSILDVGQGDSILIRGKFGSLILIDGGGGWDLDQYLPYTWPVEKCVIDLVVLTHPHADHSIGLERIARRCTVKEYWYFPSVYSGKEVSVDSLKLKVLWPPEDFRSKDPNDMSLVVLLKYGGSEVLFTGDVGGDILCSLENLPDKPDVLKVSHHGSVTGLCERLLPKNAVISVGRDNKFGHPDGEVLDYFEKNEVDVLRTDISGTIRFTLPL